MTSDITCMYVHFYMTFFLFSGQKTSDISANLQDFKKKTESRSLKYDTFNCTREHIVCKFQLRVVCFTQSSRKQIL